MKVVKELDIETWRNFVANHPYGNIFHTPEMFQVFSNTTGYQPAIWAAIAQDNTQILALFLPVNVTIVGGLLYSFTTRSIAYGSILSLPDDRGKAALNKLLQIYVNEMRGKILFTELRNLSDLVNLKLTLSENGFGFEEHLNYLINLNLPTESVLQNIGKRTRKKIRKGLRDQIVQVEEITTRAGLADWYQTLQKTYQNAQVPLTNRSMFEAVFDKLYPRGMIKFLVAKIDGVMVSASAELLFKNVIYGWYGGTDRAYSKYYPNEILIWHILKWGAENNYHVYDFGGAGRPDEEYGVRDFKAKFGGALVNFGRFTAIHSPSRLKVSALGYKLYRKIL